LVFNIEIQLFSCFSFSSYGYAFIHLKWGNKDFAMKSIESLLLSLIIILALFGTEHTLYSGALCDSVNTREIQESRLITIYNDIETLIEFDEQLLEKLTPKDRASICVTINGVKIASHEEQEVPVSITHQGYAITITSNAHVIAGLMNITLGQPFKAIARLCTIEFNLTTPLSGDQKELYLADDILLSKIKEWQQVPPRFEISYRRFFGIYIKIYDAAYDSLIASTDTKNTLYSHHLIDEPSNMI